MRTNGRLQLYPMLRLTGFMAAGITAGDALQDCVGHEAWFAAFAASVAVAGALRKWCVAQTVAIFAACALLGGWLAACSLSKVCIALPRGETEWQAVVIGGPVINGRSVACDVIVASAGRPYKARAWFARDARAERLKPGEGLTATSEMMAPHNGAASDFDYRRYMLRHGFAAVTFVYADRWHGAEVSLLRLSLPERTRIAALRLRNRLLCRLRETGLSGGGYAVVAAMAFGERADMPDELFDDYSASGALHVLSLSGLHLSIIYAMLSLVFLRRRRSAVAQVTIVCAVWTYVFVAGLPVSAVRSAVMLTVCSFVGLLCRDGVSLNALGVAAAAVLGANPLYLYDVGFQMSFVSVLFILLFYKRLAAVLPRRLAGIWAVRRLWDMAALSVAAQAGVAPLVAMYFGRFSCYFLLANIIVVPVSAVILYGVAAAMLTGWWPWLQGVACRVLTVAATLMNDGATMIARLPGSSIDGIRLNAVQTVMIYVIIFAVWGIVRKLRIKR